MSCNCHSVFRPFFQVFQEVSWLFWKNFLDLLDRGVFTLCSGVLNGVFDNDSILELHRWWFPTYQNTGGTRTKTCNFLRRGWGLWWRGSIPERSYDVIGCFRVWLNWFPGWVGGLAGFVVFRFCGWNEYDGGGGGGGDEQNKHKKKRKHKKDKKMRMDHMDQRKGLKINISQLMGSHKKEWQKCEKHLNGDQQNKFMNIKYTWWD